jgi:hypothetical protein
VLRKPFVDELVAERDAIAPGDAEVAAVIVAIVEAMPHQVEPALVDQDQEASRRALAKCALGRALGSLKFRRIDPDQPHSALPKAERVAIDNAGHASPMAAAGELRFDTLGTPCDRPHWRNDCRVEKRTGQRKQNDEQA